MSYTASYIVNSSSAQGTTDFTFTFPYIKEEHIEVYLNYNKITQGSGSAQYQVITNVSPKLIRLNTGTASANLRVEVRRNSSLGSPLVDYADGSTLTANDLDTSALQSLYIDQELKDNQGKTVSVDEDTGLPSMGESSAGNLRLTKVADPTAAQDAATKNYVDTKQFASAQIVDGTIVNADVNASAAIEGSKLQASTGSNAGSMSAADKSKLDGIETAATADQTDAEIRAAVEAASDSNVFTDADHSKLNAIEAGATADQTNAEIRAAVEAASDSNVFTDADHTKLNAIEASATADQTDAEIRAAVEAATDSNVFTDADHTKLNGIETAATADQTAAEIKTAYESNAQTNPLTDAEKAVIDGVTSNTSELNKLDGYTGSTNDLNIVSGKSFKTSSGTLDTTSDTEIPSSKVIAAHVASSQTAIGGFVTIADEVSFPTTANMPANGVVVSINNAAGVVVNGSGVSTTGRTTDGTPATVTINGFPSSLNGETLAAGVGLMVTATSTSNTYSYHKILAAETDVKQLSDDINDFNARYRIASSAPGSSNDAGDMYFDTSSNKMKVYNGTTSTWDDVASVGNFYINTISSSSGAGGGSATFNGTATRFTLSNAPTMAQQLIVSVNGVIQKPNSGTSPSEGFAVDGNDIIFSTAPASGSDYFIVTQGSSVSIGTPSDNTVTAGKIVDGSIANAKISNSAAIAGSKLADDSIPEVKLDIHNAPATGKYLKHTSNGMEWADGASEGTDVKSTGESGTAKFLRVDGDGTCSWQVPPDNNTVYTHPNHSGEVTSTADGAQVIASNVVDEDNLKVSNSPTNGQVLSAQSGNTGGLTWTTISAAPEVTATANGSISANEAVIVESDGKVAGITAQADATSSSVDGPQMDQSYGPRMLQTAWDAGNETIFAIWYEHTGTSGQSKIVCAAGTLIGASTTTVTWGSKVTVYTGTARWPQVAFLESNKFLLTWAQDSNAGKAQIATVSGTAVTLQGSPQDDGVSNKHNDSDLIALTSTKAVFAYAHGHSDDSYIKVITISGNSISFGSATVAKSSNANGGYNRLLKLTDTKCLWTYYSTGFATIYGKICTVGSSDTTVTAGTEVIFLDNKGVNHVALYDSVKGQGAMIFDYSSRHRLAALRWNYTGTTITVQTSAITVDVADGNAETYQIKGDISATGIMHIAFRDHSDSGLDYFKLVQDGDTFVTTSEVANASGASIMAFGVHSPEENVSLDVQLVAPNKFLMSYGPTSANDLRTFVRQYPATDLTTENFIGFSNAGYTNGQTATINVTGNTTTQSSLTPGQKYYVQNNGSLGLAADDPSVEAGIALTSTKLLIKG